MNEYKKFTFIKDVIGFVDDELFTTDNIKIATNFGASKLNSVVKTAILSVLAGYKEKDNIIVFDNIDLRKLIDIKEFINLNLNFKNKAPRQYDINITYKKITKEKDKNRDIINNKLNYYNSILLLSGGIDSVGGLLYCLSRKEKILPIWIDFGQKNRKSEKKVIKLIEKKLNIPILIIYIDLKDYVNKGWRHWKRGIIPARNFLFLALSSLFISMSRQKTFKVYLCASRGEINSNHNDKSRKFYKIISKLLSLCTHKDIKVWTPFYKYNKAEIIAIWQKKWHPKYRISVKDTLTCYLGNNCGLCSACYYRCINAVAVGVEDVIYKNNPFSDKGKIIRDYYISNFNKWGEIRKIDFLIALLRNKRYLSKEINQFLKDNLKNYRKKIKKRIKKLREI
jgi:7-cyano-7-deazaguanine synthase in queuosine biosynthesis